MVHSLSSLNQLKIEEDNMIYLKLMEGQHSLVRIQQQYTDFMDNTAYEDIFKIKLEAMTLPEVMLVKSLFSINQSHDIMDFISNQPNKSLFFKSFMALDHSNMTQILSFESRVITKLLDSIDPQDERISQNYPLFYQMRRNGDITTPIKVALESNQIIALNKMIEYIVKYQNFYCFSFLFELELNELIKKGI